MAQTAEYLCHSVVLWLVLELDGAEKDDLVRIRPERASLAFLAPCNLCVVGSAMLPSKHCRFSLTAAKKNLPVAAKQGSCFELRHHVPDVPSRSWRVGVSLSVH